MVRQRAVSSIRGRFWAERIALGVVVVIATGAVAAPAWADTATIPTPGWDWIEVHDTTLGISDATAYHRDVLGSGVTLKGWTEDAFDAYDAVNGYLSSIGFDHVDPGLSGYLLPVPVSFDVDPAGGATIVSEVEGHDLGGGASLDAVITLEIRGSFARWTIAVDDRGSGLVESVWGSGELGSPTAAAAVGTDGLVVTGPSGLGPVIGLQVDSDGAVDELDGSDPEFPTFTAHGASTVVYTMALLEYDPCGEGAATVAMTTLVPDLGAYFGGDLPPVHGECIVVQQPAQMDVGQPTDQVLALVQSGVLAGGHPRLDGGTYFDHLELWTSGVGVLAPDLPAGLSVEVVEHPDTLQPALHLTGTPTAVASGEIPIRLYGIRNSPDFAGEMPVAAVLRVDVDGFDLTAPEPGDPDPDVSGAPDGELADSGAAPASEIVLAAAALIGAGALLLLGNGRRRTRSDGS